MDNSHKTYLIWTMQFNLDNARPWLVEETNHYKKYSFDKKGCLYLPKFYQRRKSGIQYSLSHNSVSVQQNSKDPEDAQSLLNLTGNSNDWASDSSDSLFMKPLWFKQPPGFPSTDQVTRFSFLMEQTENLYDETVFEIVYKTNFVRDDSDIARCWSSNPALPKHANHSMHHQLPYRKKFMVMPLDSICATAWVVKLLLLYPILISIPELWRSYFLQVF